MIKFKVKLIEISDYFSMITHNLLIEKIPISESCAGNVFTLLKWGSKRGVTTIIIFFFRKHNNDQKGRFKNIFKPSWGPWLPSKLFSKSSRRILSLCSQVRGIDQPSKQFLTEICCFSMILVFLTWNSMIFMIFVIL